MKFIMLVGLPASGKSSYAKELANKENATIVSSDKVREELYGNENVQGDNALVFNIIKDRIKKLLYEDFQNVIFDATNISYKKRIQFLQDIKTKNKTINKECHIIITPYEECLIRNSKRNRVVPKYIINKMYKQINIPQYYEGWNNIKIIRNFEKSYDLNELFNDLYRVDQENLHHTLTIGNHCRSAYENITTLTNNVYLYIPALLHDIGKQHCKTFKNSKGELDTQAHYYGHEFVSAYMSLIYYSNLNDNESLRMCNYIQWHMRPFQINTYKSKNKFINLVGKDFYKELLLIHKADLMAK